MRISEIETPVLLIDLEVMERNLCRAAEYARKHGLRLRPHIKTHKVPEFARRQLELGACGVTVAKVGEAEVMLDSGTPDLLVHYPVIGRSKLERLMEVGRRTRLSVALDSTAAARQLSGAARAAQLEVGVLVEVDVGMGRTGVAPGQELTGLAQCVSKLPGLRFEGISFYPGQIHDPGEEGRRLVAELAVLVRSMVEELRRAGVPAGMVSGGSTPTLYRSHETGVNEIRPGSYIYNDLSTVEAGGFSLDDCAASFLVTVVSTPRPGQMIIDGGSKTFSSDRPLATMQTCGRIVEAPGAQFVRMNEEHGYVDTRGAGRAFTVGERLRVIPNHICGAVNLHDRVCGVRNGEVEKVFAVAARGKVQ